MTQITTRIAAFAFAAVTTLSLVGGVDALFSQQGALQPSAPAAQGQLLAQAPTAVAQRAHG